MCLGSYTMIRSRIFVFFLVIFSVQAVFGDDLLYKSDWDSLNARPLPTWYDDAKVGIFLHWGVYSVPSYGDEWFWKNWKGTATPSYVSFMKKYYKPRFTYQEFAKDFQAELFDAYQWVKMFEDSGAKYVVLTSKHHDGYTLWPSKHSFSWNSVDIGPSKDVVGLLSNAIKERGFMKFGIYYSLYEWYNQLYLDDQKSGFMKQKYVEKKVHPELIDLVNLYKPEILWSDGEKEASSEYWNSTKFLAWLYNESPVRTTVVTNDRWGSDTRCEHGGFLTCSDRFNPNVLQKRKWEKALSLDKKSWGHRFDSRLKNYVSSDDLIKEIVTTVSRGGNVLINVGPTRHGTIEPIFQERLSDMGKWLKNNGEAIYGTQPWILQKDPQTEGVWYTKKNATEAYRTNVYAIVLDYPYDTNAIELFGLAERLDNTSTVNLLGYPEPFIWKEKANSLEIQFPAKQLVDKYELKHAWTFKINIPSY